MVSNTIEVDVEELLKALRRIKRAHAKDQEYRKLRGELPADWPI